MNEKQFSRDPKNCRYCDRTDWAFKRACCYTSYSGLAIRAARRIKEGSHEHLAIRIGDTVGRWLACNDEFIAHRYSWIIPISQHWFRRITTRYNQAEILAYRISKQTKIPVKSRWLFKTRWTSKQGTKSISERLINVQGSYRAISHPDLQGRSILLVDDILTSGATAHEAAQALKKAGARHLDVATFARGVSAIKDKQLTAPIEDRD